MKEKKKMRRAVGPAQREDETGAAAFTLTNAASATECTGLIQVPPEDAEQLESYADVYSFAQPGPRKK